MNEYKIFWRFHKPFDNRDGMSIVMEGNAQKAIERLKKDVQENILWLNMSGYSFVITNIEKL